MALFGKSFDEKVQSALENVRAQFPNSNINAQVAGEDVVTLTGRTTDLDTKTQIMSAFNQAVETKNTINQISIDQQQAQQASTQAKNAQALGVTTSTEHRTHEVSKGDTLTGLAQKYYGDASKYNKIFEANRDQLNDPDKIRVGQKLKIPV